MEDAIESLKETSEEYFNVRVSKLLENKEEWVQLFRDLLPIGGHHTNNFAEAIVRILKDIILLRIKAYNLVALVDYIVNGMEIYLATRLAKYAYKKMSKPMLLYKELLQRMPSSLAENIVQVDEDTYIVPRSATGEATYEVTASLGVCLCKAGSAGAFCKHQALVHEKFGIMFPNQPLICAADRYLLGQLAWGEDCPEKDFFLDPKQTVEELDRELEELNRVYSTPSPHERSQDEQPTASTLEPSPQQESEKEESDEEMEEEIFEKFKGNWEQILKFGTESNKKGFLKFMKQANKSMGQIVNHNKAFDAMMRTAAALKGVNARWGKKIKAQWSSIKRRRPGLTKGNARVPSGMPPKSLSEGRKRKRPHKLAASIEANRPHIKKH